MAGAAVLLALAACGPGSEPSGATDSAPGSPDAFVNPICVDPSSVTMEPSLGFAGDVACLDTGVRGGGACPGVVHGGLCPPNVSIKEVAIFVRDDATSEGYVVMRAPVTAHSDGDLGGDSESVRNLPDDTAVSIESTRTDDTRARVVFRLDGPQVSVSELHHDAPL